jgi:tight adherence protein B
VETIVLFAFFMVIFFALLQGVFYFMADIREETLLAEGGLRRPKLADGVSPWLRDILVTAPICKFDNLVQTCGLKARTERVMLMMMAIIVLAMLLLNQHVSNPMISLVGGLALGAGLPLFFLVRKRTRRMTKLTAQLPECLGMIVRSLRAGHPIPVCIGLVAKEMADPVGGEFKRVFEGMAFGLDLREALIKMTQRLHTVAELKYIVSAIRIQSTSGGNLAEILESLGTLMRDQQKLKMKIKAISAEGRLSGNILAALPIGVITTLAFTSPHYYDGVGDNLYLALCLAVAATLLLVGIFVMRRILDIRV